MPFTYKTVLLVGATSGIGAGMADKLVSVGSKVIAVGRRQERLDNFVQKHGDSKAAAIRFDVTDNEGMDSFVRKVITEHPDLDCVFLNSGVQSQTRLSRAAEFDLTKFHEEINVNFTSLVNLMIKFLPHLQAKSIPTGLIVTGTHLAIVPAVTLAAYSASKAALTSFVDCLREQNRHKPTKIIEIYPPVVQTELHDYAGPRGRTYGLPLDQFTERAYKELLTGDELIVVDSIAIEPRETYMKLVEQRRRIFSKLSEVMLKHFEL
ncbi:short-chain dehydrogenase reductase family protein [Colletotrichum incanum]|uniref:Short-chain dehydrogenase reductase family protein n=1 Tax=Colletotrichum incanum TaxID=1573173 RepID=A0A167AQG0_COLIC|nr:short-chain dehydrogenase reductase family protein [Colletotrichum incanum]